MLVNYGNHFVATSGGNKGTIVKARISNDQYYNVENHATSRAFAGYDVIYQIAADCVDGYYSCSRSKMRWLSFIAHARNTSVKLISASFDYHKMQKFCPSLATVLLRPNATAHAQILVRDHSSMNELSALLRKSSLLSNLHSSADVGFLVPLLPLLPSSPIYDYVSSLQSLRSQKYKLVGVNLNIHGAARLPATSVFNGVADGLCAINQAESSSSNGIAVVYVSHDFRKDQNDILLGSIFISVLQARCPAFTPGRVKCTGKQATDAMEAKNIISLLDMVFTSRMHVSISAISCGVPIAFVAPHQGKFTYADTLFELNSTKISLSRDLNWTNVKTVSEQMVSIWHDRMTTAAKIKENLSSVKKLVQELF
jgi:polysaccharide pyruvyl transferase WcaK-like protein